MENQHRLIRGYRDLDANDIDLINEIKATGERLQELIRKVDQHVAMQSAAQSNVDRHIAAQPGRWLNMARSDLQTGIMALTRAVAQPTSF